jgi:GT2 family glycosyltransferase
MTPELSVILVVGERRDRAVPALASVLAQDVIDRLEILLLDLAPGDPPPIPGSDHPAVRIVKLPPGTLFSGAKARAIRMASAPVVVFLEEHCRTHPGWARALIEAHRGPWAGVGAEVHNGNPEVFLSRTIQILNYLWWLPPAPRAEFDMLPGHNSSFKRDLLLAYGDELEDLLRAEIVLHSRLRRDGHRLLLEPAAKFSHINESSLGSATRGRFLFNRCYGPMRARAFGWSLPRRLFYAAALPIFPFYTLSRLLQYAALRRPERLGQVIAGAPLLLFVQLASAAGHSLGLLFGMGDAEARFSLFEMNELRRHQEPVVKSQG